MTSLYTAEPGVIEIASQTSCWEHLRSTDEALLSFYTSRGRLSLAASYSVSGEQIMIAADPFDGAGWLAAGYEVTVEISGTGPDDHRWLVRAIGMARRASRAAIRSTAGVLTSGLLLPSVRVRGYYETIALEPSPWYERR